MPGGEIGVFSLMLARIHESENRDDTTWVADSLIFSEFGFSPRECGRERHPNYFSEVEGPICTTSSIYFGSGYQSVYNPYVIREFVPRATIEAKAILAARPPNWKNGLPDEEKKARILFFKP
jgi:hypothetical protein